MTSMTDGSLDERPPARLVALIHELPAALAAAQVRIADLEAEGARLGAGGPPRKPAANASLPPAQGWKARRAEPPVGTAPPKRGPRFAHAGVSRPRVPQERSISCGPAGRGSVTAVAPHCRLWVARWSPVDR